MLFRVLAQKIPVSRNTLCRRISLFIPQFIFFHIKVLLLMEKIRRKKNHKWPLAAELLVLRTQLHDAAAAAAALQYLAAAVRSSCFYRPPVNAPF